MSNKNNNIHFLGYVEGAEKANCFSSADIFVFTSHHDMWGFVVNEALYYGLLVISSDKACASKLIDNGKTGFVVKDNDIEKLAKRMEELFNNQNLFAEVKENVKKMNKSKLIDINSLIVNAHNPVPFISDVAARVCNNIPFILTFQNDLTKGNIFFKPFV